MDPIQRVREGMRVLDATGNCLGTVAEVRVIDSGTAAAATGQAPENHSGSPTRDVGHGQAPQRAAGELLERIGYVKVDAALAGDDVYFSPDDIIAVQRDTVHITQRTR